jgi:replicative DNA helicase
VSASPDPIDARVLPHSLEAEKAVLGAILLHHECFADAAEHIAAEDFYRAAHRKIFAHMTALAAKDQEIDYLTLAADLERTNELEDVGGRSYLSTLADGVPKSSHVGRYAEIVKGHAHRRQMILTATRIVADAYEAEDDADALMDRAEQAIFRVAEGEPGGGLQKLSTFLSAAMDQIDARAKAPGAITGVPTGLLDLDALTRGFQPETLVIVAARPGMGKSALVLNVAQHVAANGRTAALFSLEMSEEELTMRSIASAANIDGHRLQRGYVREREWAALSQAFGALSELELYIDASPFVTVFDIKARARRLKAKAGLDVLIVDYTQLMIGDAKQQNRTLEIASITRGLKALAKDLRIPVVALSQLNRDLERRDNKRPMLADLRDSGALEQDADIVLFIYRDDYYHPDSQEPGVAELIIAKHRGGPLGTVKVGWRGESTQFYNLAAESVAQDQRLPMGDR